MGLALSFLPFLDQCHLEGAFTEPILGLGDVKFHEPAESIRIFGLTNGLVNFTRDKSVKTFLRERYGVTEYMDCDLHDRADLKVDLAAAPTDNLRARFGVILNAGTMEHIFDQRAAYENAHLMLKPGGVVLHLAPLTWFEHSYYNYNPRFFRDLARANRYSLIVEAFHYRHANGQVECIFTYRNGLDENSNWYTSLFGNSSLPANSLYMAAYRKPNEDLLFKVPYDVASSAPDFEA